MISLHQVSFVVSCLGLSVGQICSPDNNEYYHPQAGLPCFKCDSCHRGTGKDLVTGYNKVKWDVDHGALTCIPCIPCPLGYFNDRRDYNCKPCRDCSKQNRIQLSACTRRRDAECGDTIMPLSTDASTHQYIALHTTDTDIQEHKEGPSLITLLTIILGTLAVVIISLLCFIYVKKNFKASNEPNIKMNNNLDITDPTQKVPLVVVDNTSKKRDYHGNYTANHNIETATVGEKQTLLDRCENQTTPKVLASTTDSSTVYTSTTDTSVNISQATIETVKIDNNKVKAPSNNNFLCCAGIAESSVDDVSKQSFSSGCSDLFTDTFLNDGITKSDDALLSTTHQCICNRSSCSLKNKQYIVSSGYESDPSYNCRCYNFS